MSSLFPHERLRVYDRALAFAAAASNLSSDWDRRHAVVDHLSRAAESVVLNLADGARLRLSPAKMRALDYSIGSSLECAACLDIARIKALMKQLPVNRAKQQLSEVTRMLIGLRKTWQHSSAQGNSAPYGNASTAPLPPPLFHHETLQVYRAALQLMDWLVQSPAARDSPTRIWRQIDDGTTGIVLNIAERNGRYSELDHRRFLDVAEASAVKVAAHLDLAARRSLLRFAECAPAKSLLSRIVAMLSRT